LKPVLCQALVVGDGFKWQPFQPGLVSQDNTGGLHREVTGGAVKTTGTWRSDQPVGTTLGMNIEGECVPAHQTARRVHQHVVANAIPLGVQAL
jgi:hypothetical protein